MSNGPRLASLATDLLRRERVKIDPPSSEVELKTTAALAQAIAAARRQRKIRRGAMLTFAAAAAIALAIGGRALTHRAEPLAANGAANGASTMPATIAARVTLTGHAVAGGVVLLHDGHEISLEGGSPIFAGDRVIASADGRAGVSLSTGSHVIVESGADMSVVEQDATQIFDLRTGSIRADVAKLASNERFIVRTPDAEVEVRGTSFRVAVVAADACSAGTVTRVYVSEGTVVVRAKGGESRVPAGTSWPSECTQSPEEQQHATAALPVPSVMTPPDNPDNKRHPSPLSTPLVTSQVPASELAEQNKLYGAATTAKRGGDTTNALRLYQDFIAKYPASWLAESAAVERMRILASEDHDRAREAAQAYLSRYPHGFARDEATEIAGP